MTRVLVTGATGMVGRNLLEHPDVLHHDIVAPHGRRELDLLDAEAVDAWFAAHPVDIVVHAAGRVGGIEANRRANAGFLHDNYRMGANLLCAARAHGVRRVLNLASSCMYPRDVVAPLREDMVGLGPLEPTNEGYALAKIAVMRLGDFLEAESEGAFAFRTLIPCNLFGPYDSFDPVRSHLVPAALRKVHEAAEHGGVVTIWGDGRARREFMYVGDLCDCIALAIDAFDTLPQRMNVGTGRDASVDEYYAAAAEVVGQPTEIEHDDTRPVGMMRKLLDVRVAHTWGWRAKTSLHDGLAATYQHWKKSST